MKRILFFFLTKIKYNLFRDSNILVICHYQPTVNTFLNFIEKILFYNLK